MPSTMSKMIVAGIGAAFSNFQGTIGAEERFCWNTMMSTTTRPAATGPHTCGLENFSDSACDKPVHTSTNAAVSRPAPSQSMRPPRGFSGNLNLKRTKSTRPMIGMMLMANTLRQPNAVTSRPPISGPSADDAVATAVQRPTILVTMS